MLKVFIWTLIFNFVMYFLMVQYWDRYLDGVSDMCNVDYNLSTGYKQYFTVGLFGAFTFLFCPLLYHIYYDILKQSTLYLIIFIVMLWALWDVYPIVLTDNGYKLQNIFINLFDFIYAGVGWVLISLYLYHTFHNVISKSMLTIVLLIIMNIFVTLLLFYRWYIYNRAYTENNWLVKLGDNLKWEKYSNYILIFKSKRKKSKDFHSD